MKKIFSLLFLLFCLMMVNFTSNATATKDSLNILYETQIPLYNDKEEVVAYYFELNSGGYVITNSNVTDFIEYSLDSSLKNLKKSKHYYYSGPCAIYEKTKDDKIKNYKTQETYHTDQIKFVVDPDSSKATYSLQATKTTAKSSNSGVKIKEQKSLKYATKKYDYNFDGNCGAVAAAIVLRYYNDYVNTEYISSTYETSDGKKLIRYLVNNFVGTETGYTDLKVGLNTYLQIRNISSRFKMVQGVNSQKVFKRIKTSIKNNRPLIVGLTGHPTYEEHWVVGTGYTIVYSSQLGYGYAVTVNDGWGETNIQINLKYIDGCEYI